MVNLRKFRGFLSSSLTNYFGPSTKEKIVVIESDDWGSIRMPSKRAYEVLLKNSIIDSSNTYAKYDSLETDEDLIVLFEELMAIKDSVNNPLKITANFIMANPDFQKIRQENFQHYFFEPFFETYNRYNSTSNSLSILQSGIQNSLFYPELHSREHVNFQRWMKLLSKKLEDVRIAFDNESFLMKQASNVNFGKAIVASLDYDGEEFLPGILGSLNDAFAIFYKVFGKMPSSFIAPNYIWSYAIEVFLAEKGIASIQGTKSQKSPVINSYNYELFNRKFHFDEKLNISHSIRNAFFEPSSLKNPDNAVEICLRGISNAFMYGKPAIISCHRLNFSGRIEISNRNRNIYLLKRLGKEIVSRWPDVRFLSTADAMKVLYG